MKPEDHRTGARGLDSEQRYRELYENMPVMYFEMDEHGVVISVNEFGARQLGYEPDDLIGHSVIGVFHEDDRASVEEQFSSLIATGGSIASWEFRKRRKDGSVLWVRETARAIRNAEDRLEVMVVCQDITARRRAEDERREAERLVRKLSVQLGDAQERERRRIAVHLHDEVGQTLALTRIKLGQLSEEDETLRPRLTEIQELLQHAIDDTRSLTFELASPVLYELGLPEALRSLCERQAPEDQPSFRFECAEDLQTIPERLAVPMYRIASELVFNVRKHAQARRARVALTGGDGRVHLTVEDDGRGFDPEDVRLPSGEPTTIGLFHIEQRVELLGGRLKVRSQPGQGSEVTVSFRLEPPDA